MKGTVTRLWWEGKVVQRLQKAVWQFLVKLDTQLAHGPAIPLLGIYPGETKAHVHTDLSANVLSSFICNSPNWKESRCPWT